MLGAGGAVVLGVVLVGVVLLVVVDRAVVAVVFAVPVPDAAVDFVVDFAGTVDFAVPVVFAVAVDFAVPVVFAVGVAFAVVAGRVVAGVVELPTVGLLAAGEEPIAALLPTDDLAGPEASTPVSWAREESAVAAAPDTGDEVDFLARPATRKMTPTRTATEATITATRRSQ
ncbi:hypothetical protein SAMN04515671_2439 [Nakamurella panacisegetis]|uniref:Uncharacterized protein n=1 Tax=Nakamurella panacisegetis TaxID=1090615 RepID=A0A1H0NQL5_9ACTN|nr:hypothetical protein SAMN04515671_2439 [Nakamurella panacisegetis]